MLAIIREKSFVFPLQMADADLHARLYNKRRRDDQSKKQNTVDEDNAGISYERDMIGNAVESSRPGL